MFNTQAATVQIATGVVNDRTGVYTAGLNPKTIPGVTSSRVMMLIALAQLLPADFTAQNLNTISSEQGGFPPRLPIFVVPNTLGTGGGSTVLDSVNTSLRRLPIVAKLYREIDTFETSLGAITGITAAMAKKVIEQIPSLFPLPHAAASDDGEVGLSWIRGRDRVEVFVDPDDQRLVWIGKFNGRFVDGGDEPWGELIPASLIEMLSRLYPKSL